MKVSQHRIMKEKMLPRGSFKHSFPNLVLVELTVLKFSFSLLTESDDDKPHNKEDGDLHAIVVHRAVVLPVCVYGFVEKPETRH